MSQLECGQLSSQCVQLRSLALGEDEKLPVLPNPAGGEIPKIASILFFEMTQRPGTVVDFSAPPRSLAVPRPALTPRRLGEVTISF